MSSTRNAILTAAAAIAVTLTAKNRGAASSAVTAAVVYQGSDRNLIDAVATAAGVSVTYQGSDENYLALVVTAVDDLPTL